MERYIEFFNIGYNNFNMYNGEEHLEIRHKAFIELLKNSLETKEYMLKVNNKEENPSIIIEVIEIDDNYIYGLLGKLDDLSKKTLLRIRGKGIDEIHKVTSPEELDFLVENFTYFCIRVSDLTCALLQNGSAPSFRKHFLNLIKEELPYKENYFDDIYIVSIIDEDIPEKLLRFKDILSLNIGYRNKDNIVESQGIVSLEDEFNISQSDIEYANIKLSLKKGINLRKMKKQLSEYKQFDDYNNFKVNGIDENDAIKCIDLINNIITQKVHIDIEEEFLISTDGEEKIKEELKKVLQSI